MHFREQGLTEEEAKLRLYYFCDTCGKNYANKVKSVNVLLTPQELSRQQQGKLEASQATRAREVQRGGALRRLWDFFQNQGAPETGLILDF